MLGLGNRNLIFCICEFDVNCNKKNGLVLFYRFEKNIVKWVCVFKNYLINL